MKSGAKVLAVLAALGCLSVPAASSAGKRPIIPVGLHLAPVVGMAVEPTLGGKRENKKVEKENNLLGSPVSLLVMMVATNQASQALRPANRFASSGAN